MPLSGHLPHLSGQVVTQSDPSFRSLSPSPSLPWTPKEHSKSGEAELKGKAGECKEVSPGQPGGLLPSLGQDGGKEANSCKSKVLQAL